MVDAITDRNYATTEPNVISALSDIASSGKFGNARQYSILRITIHPTLAHVKFHIEE